jgi:hypothetical protein
MNRLTKYFIALVGLWLLFAIGVFAIVGYAAFILLMEYTALSVSEARIVAVAVVLVVLSLGSGASVGGDS